MCTSVLHKHMAMHTMVTWHLSIDILIVRLSRSNTHLSPAATEALTLTEALTPDDLRHILEDNGSAQIDWRLASHIRGGGIRAQTSELRGSL